MKKIVIVLFASMLLSAQSVFAARALVRDQAEIYFVSAGSWRLEYNVVYAGADVPGNIDYEAVSVTIDGTTTLTQLAAAVASAIRTRAVALGFTVPANGVVLPTLQLG